MSIVIPDKRRFIEIIAVLTTGIGKIVFVDVLKLKFYFIVIAALFWIAFVIIRIAENEELLQYWGLSFKNIKPTFVIVGIVGIILIISILLHAIFLEEPMPGRGFIFILLAYPLWGLLQQYLMMSLFAGNLKDLSCVKINDYIIVAITCIIFSIVHYPCYQLILATFIMSLFYTIVFINKRNIIPLGIFHGIIGCLFYYFILDRDPWSEFIAILNL